MEGEEVLDSEILRERSQGDQVNEFQRLTLCEKEDTVENDSKNTCTKIKFNGVRYVILIITILCMAAIRANDTSFSFTFICMTSNTSVNNYEPVLMTATEVGILFGGSGVGALMAVFPVVYALHYLGPRFIFTSLLLLSSVATWTLPLLAQWSPFLMLPARVQQGLAFSAVLPLMGCVSAQWAPLTEITMFMTLLSSSNQLAQIISTPMSAHLCVTSGWQAVFYTHGIISFVLTVHFFVLFRRSPHEHPSIKHKELHLITCGEKKRKKRVDVPYRRIITTKSVWAIWVAFLGNAFGFQLIIQFMPTFLNKVLSVPITRTGFAGIVPPLTQLLVKLFAGWICDYITCINELRKIQIFNSIAMIGCGLFFLPLGYLPTITSNKSVQQLIAILCFTSSTSCLGLVSCGSMKSVTLIARDFSHFIMAAVQLLVSVSMLSVPAIVNWLAPANTLREWRLVFFLFFAVLFLSNIFFCRFCGAELEPWAALNRQPDNSKITIAIPEDIKKSASDVETPLIVEDCNISN